MTQLYDRCTKFYLSIDGVEAEIAEPINWASITVYLKRDAKYYGVNFEFSDGEVLLKFDCKAGKEELDTLYNTDGNDSEAYLLFDELPDGVTRTNLFTGKLDFNTYECEEFTTALSVKRVYFGDLLRSRLDLETSFSQMLTVDGNAAQNPSFRSVELHSKTIQKTSRLEQLEDEELNIAIGSSPLFFTINGGGGTQAESGTFYIQWGFDTQTKSDLATAFILPLANSLNFPDAWIYEAVEQGAYQVDLAILSRVLFRGFRDGTIGGTNNLACGGDGYWNEVTLTTILRHTTANDVTIADYQIRQDVWTNSNPSCHNNVTWDLSYNDTLSQSINMQEGEKLYLFTQVDVSGDYNQPLVGPRLFEFQADLLPYQKTSFLNIQANTLAPASNANLLMVHEALTKLVSNITGVNGAVKSDFFGRVDYFDRTYLADGCGAFLALQNGLGVRGFGVDEKPAFVSLSSLLDSLQAIYNIGVQFSQETRAKQVETWQRRYSTLTELEQAESYSAPVNNAYSYTILLEASPVASVRPFTAQAEIYCDAVLVDTLSIDEVTTSDSYIASGCDQLQVVITGVTGGENTDFARLQILETQPSQQSDLLIVEDFEYFFQDTELLQISSFENYTEEVATDYIFNSVSVGYSKWENEKVNGLDEFATAQQNGLPIKTARVDKQLISELVASGYAIEFTRRLGQGTEDSSYDSDIFAIQLRKVGTDYFTEKDEPFDSVSGIIDPATAYNLRLSPKRNLLNWASYLNGCLFYKASTDEIVFLSGQGNFDLSTQFNNSEPCLSGDNNRIVLDERGNIALSDFNAKASPFRPEICRFRAVLSFDELLTIKDTPYGYISVLNTPKGNIQGYLLSLEYKPDIEAGYTDFVLLKKQ